MTIKYSWITHTVIFALNIIAFLSQSKIYLKKKLALALTNSSSPKLGMLFRFRTFIFHSCTAALFDYSCSQIVQGSLSISWRMPLYYKTLSLTPQRGRGIVSAGFISARLYLYHTIIYT